MAQVASAYANAIAFDWYEGSVAMASRVAPWDAMSLGMEITNLLNKQKGLLVSYMTSLNRR